MKRYLVFVVAAAAAPACSSGDAVAVQWQTLDGLNYAVPTEWVSIDQSEQFRKVVVWAPPSNTSKQTVSVIRTRPTPSVTSVGLPKMERLLAATLAGLPSSKFSAPEKIVTAKGLAGMRARGEFLPQGATQHYIREHAVLLDGDALVHVMFTAQDANTSRESMQVVLDTLHREGV